MTRMAAAAGPAQHQRERDLSGHHGHRAVGRESPQTRAATRACRSRRWSGGGTPPSRSDARTSRRTSPCWRPFGVTRRAEHHRTVLQRGRRHHLRLTAPRGSHGRRAGPLRRDAHPARPALHPPRSDPRRARAQGARGRHPRAQRREPQRWRFIVKDAETKRWIQQRYRNTPVPATRCRGTRPRPGPWRATTRPPITWPSISTKCPCSSCAASSTTARRAISIAARASIQRSRTCSWPRGLGLASVLTTRPRRGFNEIKEKPGIPDNVDTAALLPLGYPAAQNRYGPTNRRPVEDVTFGERWGRPWEAGARPHTAARAAQSAAVRRTSSGNFCGASARSSPARERLRDVLEEVRLPLHSRRENRRRPAPACR